MKRCPKCNRAETDDALAFCRADGTRLVSDDVNDGAVTVLFDHTPQQGNAETRTLSQPVPLSPVSTPAAVINKGETRALSTPNLRRGIVTASVMLVVAAVAVSAYVYLSRGRSAAPKNSIAVLPFQNASGHPNMEYLSDGITENLINSLTQLPGVRVLARSTMFRFKGQNVDPVAIGKQLGVDTVLTGKVVQVGESLSVQADLLNVSDGSQLWGEQYSRTPSDLVILQREIARDVSNKLRVRLSAPTSRNLQRAIQRTRRLISYI